MSTCNDSPALRQQSKHYPAYLLGRVPKRVRMTRTMRSDLPAIIFAKRDEPVPVVYQGQEYDVWVNSHGAVAAVLPDGNNLGLRPDEFEVVAWHEIPTGGTE